MLADAFLVLFPYKGKGELVTYCEAYSRALNGFIVSREQNYQLELRSGICCVEDSDASDINSLLDRANMALKPIKVKGAAQWKFYDHTMRDKLLREKDLEIRMEKALADGGIPRLHPAEILGRDPGPRGRGGAGALEEPGSGIPFAR